MLATEFARKYNQEDGMQLNMRAFVLNELLKGGADSHTIRETALWCFFNNIEAAFILASEEKLLDRAEDGTPFAAEIPLGLYDELTEQRVS